MESVAKPRNFTRLEINRPVQWAQSMMNVAHGIFDDYADDMTQLMYTRMGKRLKLLTVLDPGLATEIMIIFKTCFGVGFIKGVTLGEEPKRLTNMVEIANDRYAKGK